MEEPNRTIQILGLDGFELIFSSLKALGLKYKGDWGVSPKNFKNALKFLFIYLFLNFFKLEYAPQIFFCFLLLPPKL